MADVYVAFVRDDQSYAEALAVALQGSGFTVSRSASVVEAIDECGAIIVLWTPAAARSKLFVDAADRAFRSGKMVMARMGAEPLPQMFAGVEAHSLARWSGDPESPEIDDIVFHVDRLVSRTRLRAGGEAPPETGHAQQRERGVVHRFPAGGGGGGAMRAAARPMEAPAQRAPAPQPYQASADPLAEEAAYWRRIQHSNDPNEFYAYMERYGRNGTFAELAEQRMRSLAPRPAPRSAPPMSAPMPAPMPPPMQQHGHGHRPPPVQRGGFSMNPPMPRPAPNQAQPRLDPHPARTRVEPDISSPSQGGGGVRGLMFLIFLAMIGGGGFYVYQQLQGPAPAAVENAEEPWTPPAGTPAEPDTSLAAATERAAAPTVAAAPQRMVAERRQQPKQVEAPEPPPPPPIFRTLPASPPPTPASAAVTDDLQRDVGPTVAAAPIQVAAAPVQVLPAAAPRTVRPRWAQRPSARDMQGAYPASAQRRSVQGRVVLDCLIGTDLAIRCRSISETPAGYGFATAALRVAQQFRAGPTLEDGRPAAGERAQVVLVFKPE